MHLSAALSITLAVVLIACLVSLTGCGGTQKRESTGTQERESTIEKSMPDIRITHKKPEDSSLAGSSIAFMREDQIWFARGNGNEQRRLTDGLDANPAVSQDGKVVAYEHQDQEALRVYDEAPREEWHKTVPYPSRGIFAVPSAGGEPERITPPSWMTRTGWTSLFENESPDETFDHTRLRRDCLEPSFSPDGRSICFIVRDQYENFADPSSYYAVAKTSAVETGGPTILSVVFSHEGGGSVLHCPRFSPDGTEIYVNCVGGPNGNFEEGGIFKVSSDGGELVPVCGGYWLADVSSSLKVMAASPSSVAGSSSPDRIVLLGMDGTRIRDVYASPTQPSPALPGLAGRSVSFTPSGETLAFVGQASRDSHGSDKQPTEVFAIPSDGGEPVKVISDGSQPCFGGQQ